MPSSLHRRQYEIFRAMLLSARETAGLTQVEVAVRLCRPQRFVSKYERGERRLGFTEFVELANVLGIDSIQFFADYKEQL
jgi:transcriptional regulator with XRE-family HTH domain